MACIFLINPRNPMIICTEILIIGAGPGGLACARILAENGRRVVVVERQRKIGPKVCAGGITWSGLIQEVPENLIERTFAQQVIRTRYQHTVIREDNPIVATIGRETLGKWMADQAEAAGARILTKTRVAHLDRDRALLTSPSGEEEIRFRILVGADGSRSLVRRFLGLPMHRAGIGINVQVAGQYPDMEWHLDSRYFGSGYGWIFPHRDTVSIGAYGDQHNLAPAELKERFLRWADQQGFDLHREQTRAAWINADFRGWDFGHIFLVGDAAGLASGLTGEGIYPALISGRAVARKIIDPDYPAQEIDRMVRKQKRHHQVIRLAAKNRLLCTLLMEWLVFLLRIKLLDFHALEMAE